MQTEQIDSAEKALANEFSDYLASVSREVVAPITANIARHQADVEKMLAKVADACAGVESEFGRQREYLDSVRKNIDEIVKESELKIARLHSSSQSLLENSRQRIVAELIAVSDQAGNTVRQIGDENKNTSVAIDVHHQALRRLTEEHREATARIFNEANAALSRTFESHRTNLNGAASELLQRFESIAKDVEHTTGELGAVHEETRVRLFTQFSAFQDSVRVQIDSCHDALRRDISSQIEGKSEDVIKLVGSGISSHYSAQFSSLEAEIRNGMGKLGDSAKGQGERLDAAIVGAIADVVRSVTESQTALVAQMQKELSVVKSYYLAQFSSLEAEIRNGMGKLGDSAKGQGERLDAAIVGAFADVVRSVTESQAALVAQMQKELSVVKKLMIGMIVVVAGIVAAGFTIRF